jgi:hypothetical protein
MATKIDEPITVGAVFRQGGVRPAWFIWRGRRYEVREVTMSWATAEGRERIRHVSVTDGASEFELALNQERLTWRLVAVDADGCE